MSDQHDAGMSQFVHMASELPCTLDVQVTMDHELEFHFDAIGHITKIACSCGKVVTVKML